ncbi:MAG: hypothetical protein ACYC0Y_25580 [Pirellulales bacterium]
MNGIEKRLQALEAKHRTATGPYIPALRQRVLADPAAESLTDAYREAIVSGDAQAERQAAARLGERIETIIRGKSR